MRSIIVAALLLLAGAAIAEAQTCNSPCTITKTAYESFDVTVDFAQVMGSDVITIDSASASVKATGVDVTSQLIAQSPAPAIQAGTYKIVIRVQAGLSGALYRISVKAIDSTTGAKWEGLIYLQIS